MQILLNDKMTLRHSDKSFTVVGHPNTLCGHICDLFYMTAYLTFIQLNRSRKGRPRIDQRL